MESALTGVTTALWSAAGDILDVVPAVVGAAVGLMVVRFGARWVIGLFKGTAK